MQKSESHLQQQCFMWHWNNYPSERGCLRTIHNNAVNKIQGAQLKAIGVQSGTPDMFLVTNKGVIWLELKDGKGGVQSKAQKDFESLVKQRSGQYNIIRSLDEFITLIQNL